MSTICDVFRMQVPLYNFASLPQTSFTLVHRPLNKKESEEHKHL